MEEKSTVNGSEFHTLMSDTLYKNICRTLQEHCSLYNLYLCP